MAKVEKKHVMGKIVNSSIEYFVEFDMKSSAFFIFLNYT